MGMALLVKLSPRPDTGEGCISQITHIALIMFIKYHLRTADNFSPEHTLKKSY